MADPVDTSATPRALGPYSQTRSGGGLLFVSGQIPLDPATGELVQGTVEDETRRALGNLRAVLGAAGVGLEAVVKTTVYVTDLADYSRVNGVYAEHFTAPFPARALVQVSALPKGARVEIDAVAVLPPTPGSRP